jgi:hypothetical protein
MRSTDLHHHPGDPNSLSGAAPLASGAPLAWSEQAPPAHPSSDLIDSPSGDWQNAWIDLGGEG